MIALALLLQALPPPTPPGQPPATMVVEPVAMMIAAFDADGDARVTKDELERGLRRSFDAIDSAKTGKLGYIGFADWAERFLGDRNALPSPFETDSNGDDRITPDELQAKIAGVVARLDRDKDGTLTRVELLTIRRTAGGEREPPKPKLPRKK